MTYIVAVSGGVDSVVLLDKMVHLYGTAAARHIIVAHFDHGIRPDSAEDAHFVEALAAHHGLTYKLGKARLGAQASEARAREHRYAFLNDLAKKYGAEIVTAHHLDDLVETVAINLSRGTGWRGLAVFSAPVTRPLIHMTKAELVDYARRAGITWREDSTNQSDVYLRNRLRKSTAPLPLDTKRQIHALHAEQRALADAIHNEVTKLIGTGPQYNRYFFIHVAPAVAIECLRAVTAGRLTRPQLRRLLHAVKVSQPGSTFEAGEGVKVKFSTRQFSL